jgi:4-amino-4-deoxy-L-arabinose transferase-like glycosyltransferase
MVDSLQSKVENQFQRQGSGKLKVMGEKQKSNRITILLVVSLLQMGVSALLLNNLSMDGWSVIYAEDSKGYLLAARFFLGEEIPSSSLPLLKYRLFSPVIPFMASLTARFLSLEYSFLFLNFCFWLFSVYLLYGFSKNLLDERLAYYCTLLFTTSLPMIIWGLPVMVDMAAFFFALLNCWLITRLLSDRSPRYMVVALTLPLAILAKPNLFSLLLFFMLYAVFQRRYSRILPVVFITFILVGVVYLGLGLGEEDFVTYGYLRHQGFFYVVNALVFCFHWGFPLAVWGYFSGKGQRDFYLTYLISTFGGYLLFVHNPRLLFIIYPAVLPLVVRGMEACAHRIAERWQQKPERTVTALVFGYMLTSNVLTLLYLLITRTFQYRSVESLKHLLK